MGALWRAAACVVLLWATPGAHAQAMYKWIDEKGVTHYSHNPPPDSKAQKIEVKPAGPPPRSPGSTQSWKERELDARQKRLERQHEEDEQRGRSEEASAERKHRCERARRDLTVLEHLAPAYTLDAQKQKVYLDDKDRPREIEETKERISRFCD